MTILIPWSVEFIDFVFKFTGIGSFEIIDDKIVNGEDVGSKFVVFNYVIIYCYVIYEYNVNKAKL